MKTKLTLLLAAIAAFSACATEDALPVEPAAEPAPGRGNCDLMASNTVRAVFRGIQQNQDGTQTAIFEVVQNLAHKRIVRYGDGIMPVGMIFTVALDRNMPGQPASIVDEITLMQVGEEAVMMIDHLFLFDEPQGVNLRPCVRMARKPATPATVPYPIQPGVAPTAPVAPAAPVAPTPGSGTLYGAAN